MIKLIKGQKFSRLEFLEVVKESSPRKIRLLCDCGKIVDVWLSNLNNGHTKSCGCLAKEVTSKVTSKHRMSTSKEYKSWSCMVYRCTGVNKDRKSTRLNSSHRL